MAGGPWILDTSAFLGGRALPEPGSVLVPEAVVAELERPGRDRRRLENLLAAGAEVVRCDAATRRRVEAAARGTGDLPRMSPADLEVLAVALERGAEVLSDDYRIQNVGRAVGVAVRGSDLPGIRAAWTWSPRCTGCRRILPEPADVCPVCGSEVRLVRADGRSGRRR